MLTLGNLFHIYSNPTLDSQIREAILSSLEKRWAKADQDVFILAVFLNPYIRQHPFSRAALTHANVYEIAARVFKRIFGQDPDLDFLKAFEDYFNNRAGFSSDSMGLEMMKSLYADQVCGSNSKTTFSPIADYLIGHRYRSCLCMAKA